MTHDLPSEKHEPLADDISRMRRAFLATKRDELLTPARVIGDITTRILHEAETVDESVGLYSNGTNLGMSFWFLVEKGDKVV